MGRPSTVVKEKVQVRSIPRPPSPLTPGASSGSPSPPSGSVTCDEHPRVTITVHRVEGHGLKSAQCRVRGRPVHRAWVAPAPPSTRTDNTLGKPPKPWRPQFPWAPFTDAADGPYLASGLQPPRGGMAPACPRVPVASHTVGLSDVAQSPRYTGQVLQARCSKGMQPRGEGARSSCGPGRQGRKRERRTSRGSSSGSAPSPAPPRPGSHPSQRQGRTEIRGSFRWQGWLSCGHLCPCVPQALQLTTCLFLQTHL